MAPTTPDTPLPPHHHDGQWKPIASTTAHLVAHLANAALAHPRNDNLRDWIAADPAHAAQRLAAELAWFVLRRIAWCRAAQRNLLSTPRPRSVADPDHTDPITLLDLAAVRSSSPLHLRGQLIQSPAEPAWPALQRSAAPVFITASDALAFDARLALFATAPIEPNHDTRLLSLAYEASLAWSASFASGPGSAGPLQLQLRFGSAASKARHAAGAFSTPDPLIAHVLNCTLRPTIEEFLAANPRDPSPLASLRLCDPAAGVGRFLVAAGWMLAHAAASTESAQPPPPDAIARAFSDLAPACLVGVDSDPQAVTLCQTCLWLEASHPALTPASFTNIHLSDALLTVPMHAAPEHRVDHAAADAWCRSVMKLKPDEPAPAFFHWPLEYPAAFDVVIGNPPFLNQLRSETASSRAASRLLRAQTAGIIRRYADISAAFLMLALDLAKPAGRVGFVMPQSTLSAGDIAEVRRFTLNRATLDSLWVSRDPVFAGTTVQACAITLTKHAALSDPPPSSPITIHRAQGSSFTPLPPLTLTTQALRNTDTWSPLIADAFDVPAITIQSHRTIADIASATADFRDQYYGLVGHIIESQSLNETQLTQPRLYPKLITSGLIALANLQWATKPTRLHKQTWQAPRVNTPSLIAHTNLKPWLDARLVPKLLVATQTRTIQAIVDENGQCLPSVPVLTATPHHQADLWKLAAAACSPVASAIAMTRHLGSALSRDAIKLSARQLLALPLPTIESAWLEAADLFQAASHAATEPQRHAALERFALISTRAYALTPDQQQATLNWWNDRLAATTSTGRSASAQA